MPLDNDTRGWIMAAVSGIACTVGASIICVDLIVRQFPGQRHFKVEDSNSFLSAGLSLSFGVMIFSSLYSMLPSARNYLEKGGMGPKKATLFLVGCFLLGALGISIVSRVLHRYIPHSVVDCDHEHGDEEEGKVDEEHAAVAHEHPMEEQRRGLPQTDTRQQEEPYASYGSMEDSYSAPPARRPSLHTQISSKVSQLVTGQKEFCDEHGQCFGYSDPCGQECFRNVQHVRPPRLHSTGSKKFAIKNPSTGLSRAQTMPHERQPLLQGVDETAPTTTFSGPASMENSAVNVGDMNGHSHSHPHTHPHPHNHSHPHSHHQTPRLPRQRSSSTSSTSTTSTTTTSSSSHSHPPSQHHHHVPTNAFLSIGLQTSTAIALHKIPEGFITYATNHANPTLGLSIFLALFIHNITEGFAMALPLYLAIGSRWKAMFWSALLGGVSQPLGAGVAALWFRVAGRNRNHPSDGSGNGNGNGEPGDIVYGAMFAVTAGVMAMVSLQLLGESLDLTHSKRLCFISAFVGMGVLGASSALTA